MKKIRTSAAQVLELWMAGFETIDEVASLGVRLAKDEETKALFVAIANVSARMRSAYNEQE